MLLGTILFYCVNVMLSTRFGCNVFGLNMCMLEIYLSSTKVEKYPSIRIFIDDDLMEELQLESKQQCIKIPLAQADGEHTLTIEHFGKTNKDIVVRDNKILQDTTFTIEKIVLDGIELNKDILLECKFVPNWNGMEKPINFPSKLPQVRTVGPNGEWTVPFALPVEDWLIKRIQHEEEQKENKIRQTGQMGYEISPHSTLYHKLDKTDQDQIERIKKLIHG